MAHLACTGDLHSRSKLKCALVLLLVAIVVLFAGTTTSRMGAVTLRVDETSAPGESEQESQEKLEEGLVNGQRRFRVKAGFRKVSTNAHKPDKPRSQNHSRSPRFVAGHRLSHDLLAPLTC